jgi:hypothetical protein
MRKQEDLASSPPHAVRRDIDDGSGLLSVTFTCAKCRNVHSRWGTRKQTTLLASAHSCDTAVRYVEAKNVSISLNAYFSEQENSRRAVHLDKLNVM